MRKLYIDSIIKVIFILSQFFVFNSVFSQCSPCSPGGAIHFSANTTITSSACYTGASMDNQKTITIQSGVTLTICGDFTGNNGDGIIVNSGATLIITGKLDLLNTFQLISNGTVTIGSIELGNGTSMQVEGTGTLAVTGNVSTGSSSSITVAAGGSIDVGGSLTAGSGATITVSGSLDVEGSLSVTSGTITATGTIEAASISGATTPLSAIRYRSVATGNWNANSTWESSTNGTTWSAASATPTSDNDTITIRNGHNVSVTASVSADELTVNLGGTLTVNSGQTLTIANGVAATDCQVNGTLSNVGVVTTTGALAFGSTGEYAHAQAGGTVPLAIWATTSTCKITGATTALPSGITNTGSQTNMFGNFIWDCSSQSSEINFAGTASTWTTFTLEGSFTVNNTGSSNLIFSGDATNVNRTFTVKGNFEIAKTGTATVFYLNEYYDNITLNVYGEILITGGTFYASKRHDEDQIINVEKGLEVSGTGVFKSQNQTADHSLYTTINFTNTQAGGYSSNLSLSTGLTRYGQAAWNINIKNGRIITLTSNIELGKDRIFTVESGGTLILPPSYVVKNNTNSSVATGTTFVLNSGGILKIQNVDGIVTSGANGGIQTNTRTFNAGGHYHYIASAAQVTGNALPATISGSLIINNTQAINASNTGVSLSQATTISGTLSLTAGVLTTTTNLLSITNTSSAAISGGSATAFVNGPLKWTVANSGGGNYKFQIGKSGVYLPLNVGSPVGTTPAISAQAFVTSSGGSASTGLTSISTSEYWSIINTGTLTSSTISLAKSDIGSNDAIASSTTLAAAYTNNLGTCTTTSILITSNTITAGTTSGSFATATYFVMAAKLGATITLAANTVVAANSCTSSLKVPIQSFSLAVTVASGNLTNVGFTTTGNYLQADIDRYQLWYGSANSIGSAVQLGTNLTSSGGAGARTFSAFTSPTLTSGITYYFWITADVTSGATNNNTIAVSAITTSNLTSSSTKAGSTSAGGTQTLNTSTAITSQTSVSETRCPGSSSFTPISITATGANLTYQWYSNPSATASGGTSVSGATLASYTPASNTFGTKYYYCIVSGSCGANVTSSVSEEIVVTPTFSSILPTTSTFTYIWNGTTTNWKTASNWLYYNNLVGTYTVSSTSPSNSDKNICILIPINAGCVTNLPTLISSSSLDSTDLNSLTIEPGSTFTVAANSGISIHGNFINNGTFSVSPSSYVSFEGSTAQTISGTAPTFAKLIVRNTSGVTLGVSATVTGELSLVSGKLYTQGNTLSIGTSTANGSVTGGSASAYVVAYDNGGVIGKVKHYINSAESYVFPIGDATNYTPLTYTHNSATILASDASIDVYTKPVKVLGLSPNISYYLNRFWEVTPTGITGPNYNISFVYASSDRTGTGIESTLYPIKLSGGIFNKPIGSSFLSAIPLGTSSVNTSTRTLSWLGLTSFSSFGGAGNSPVSLPISLISFTGKNSGTDNELKWVTASEKNNNYFTIEKTTDGSIFDILGVIKGAGTTNAILDYQFIDYNVSSTFNYYRLKQTDFDGVFKYTDLISIDNRSLKVEKQITKVTNILGQEVNENFRGLVIIVYTDGSSEKVIR